MKNWSKIILYAALGLAVLVLWIIVAIQKDQQLIQKPEIIVHVEGKDAMVNEVEINERLMLVRAYDTQRSMDDLDVLKIEKLIRGMEEVKDVQVYTLLGGSWTIEVWLRRPIARIFNANGNSYYIDSEGNTVKKTNLHVAKVLPVSGYFNEPLHHQSVSRIINNDSLKNIRKLDDAFHISKYVCNDPVLKLLIGQVYLDEHGDFILIPIVGDQKIIFGSAESENEVENKCKRLVVFYQEALPYEGWNKYAEINLKFDGQVVSKLKKWEKIAEK